MQNESVELRVENGNEPDTRKVTVEFTLRTDIKKMNEANLGLTWQTCKICEASGDFQTWRLIEMQYGTEHEFRYFECPECETLQIERFPENIGDYYPNDYYSYNPLPLTPPKPGARRDTRMILDVGCGAGKWLCDLAGIGCVNLYGCDPFIEKDVKLPNGVKINKCTIHAMEGKYDVIAFNDSLEHMPDPHEVFKTLDRLLKHKSAQVGPEAPKIEIGLPIFPSLMTEIYGMYLYSLDAPRHYFLYSEKALSMMAKQYGFYIEERKNLPSWGELAVSRAYQLGFKLLEFHSKFKNGEIWDEPNKQEQYCEVLARCASLVDRNSQARFTLKRKDDTQ